MDRPRLVRPETRAALANAPAMLEHYGPGDALVQRWADWGLFRLCRRPGGDDLGPSGWWISTRLVSRTSKA
eukprot:Skav236215  [mRNA]  locus=scaffold98:368171:368383:- [translate_table: standard]